MDIANEELFELVAEKGKVSLLPLYPSVDPRCYYLLFLLVLTYTLVVAIRTRGEVLLHADR